MRITLKYTGSTGSLPLGGHGTHNATYLALGITAVSGDPYAVIKDDNGYFTVVQLSSSGSAGDWVVDSIVAGACETL